MDTPEIIAPIATVTITYGIDSDGDLAHHETWKNGEGDSPVPMIIRAGMLTMAQQSLTFDCLPSDEDD